MRACSTVNLHRWEISSNHPHHPVAGVDKLLKAQAQDAQGPGWEQRKARQGVL